MSIARLMQLGAAGVPTGPEGAWDLSYAYYDDPYFWDSSTINASGIGSLQSGGFYGGVHFKTDGTKVYVVDSSNDVVGEYSLSTAWDITTISFVQNFSVSAQESNPRDLFFKPDGTEMYVVGSSGDDVNQYSLSTAWDISTASYTRTSADLGTALASISFKPDGTRMYIGDAATNEIEEYSLSIAWDVSTASSVQFIDIGAQGAPEGIFIKPDGTRLYAVSNNTNIHEYSLSTAWDISTASFVQTTSLATSSTTGVFFKPDGSIMYTCSGSTTSIRQYGLGGFDVSGQAASMSDIFFKPDGTSMYLISENDNIYEYSLSTGFDTSTASYVGSTSISAWESIPQGIFFKPDGTKMYITGESGDDVNEFNLSPAWDISTRSFVQNFSVSSQDTAPLGLFFKGDGTKMYISGGSSNNIYEYTLSTGWDLSSASYDQSFDVSARATQAQGVFFKPDGKRMYVVTDSSEDDVLEYSLSTAWDISSASFTATFDVSSQGDRPFGISFNEEGTLMRIIFQSPSAVFGYSLGVPE